VHDFLPLSDRICVSCLQGGCVRVEYMDRCTLELALANKTSQVTFGRVTAAPHGI
jgi:hypothetical protein